MTRQVKERGKGLAKKCRAGIRVAINESFCSDH